MDKIFLRKLTAAMMVSAGLLAVDLGPLYAQSQSQQGNASGTQSTQGTSQNKNKQGAHTGNHGASAKMGSTSAGSTFVKKAAESNMAEIELSRLALQNASAQQVKDYAQQMIDHHTMAQQELTSIVSGSASMKSGQSDNDANMDDSNSGNTSSGNTSSSPNVSGGTTGSGSTYSSGNASGAEGTQGNVTGQGSNATTGKQGNSSGSNDPDASNKAAGTTGGSKSGLGAGSNYESSSTGGGGAGANSGGTTSSSGLGSGSGTGASSASPGSTDANRPSGATNSNTDMSNNAGTSTSDTGSGTAGNTNNSAGNTSSSATSSTDATGGMNHASAMYGDLPTQLSAEHQALHTKLSKLNGAEFDRQYIQAMVKDHAKAVELFEKQSKSSADAALQGYATKNLPLIKQHYQMAQKLSASKSSSTKGTSDSK